MGNIFSSPRTSSPKTRRRRRRVRLKGIRHRLPPPPFKSPSNKQPSSAANTSAGANTALSQKVTRYAPPLGPPPPGPPRPTSPLPDLPSPRSLSPGPPPYQAHLSPTVYLPPQFSIYREHFSSRDFYIAATPSSRPLFAITAYSGWSGNADLVLHSSSSYNSLPLATADFHSLSTTIDLRTYLPNPSGGPRIRSSTQLERQRVLSNRMVFSTRLPDSGRLEHFEWRTDYSGGLYSFTIRRCKMELVRVTTREVVATWTAASFWDTSNLGSMAWVGSKDELGEKVGVLAVVSMLAILVQARRRGGRGTSHGGMMKGGGASSGATGRAFGGC